MMEKEFVNYEIALELKELGFNEPCIGFWWNNKDFTEPEFLLEYCEHVMDGNLKRPTFSQAFRWFREKYNLNSFVIDSKSYNWYFNINDTIKDDVVSEVLYFKTYKEAELECLKKLIEIVKEQK